LLLEIFVVDRTNIFGLVNFSSVFRTIILFIAFKMIDDIVKEGQV